jgi:hypothetical protein
MTRDQRRDVGGRRYAREMALLLAVVIAAALVVKFWPVIVGVIGMIVDVHWGRRAVDRHAECVESAQRRLAEMAARADQQHAWATVGDERGVFGKFPPAAM